MPADTFEQLAQAITNEGERYLPDPRFYSAAMHLGHMASYREVLRYSYGQRVLDVGCGVGYGSFFLACYGARSVTALDIGAMPLRYAQRAYAHPKLKYLQVDANHLPFANQTFDVIFASQVIEHVKSADGFMRETARLLAPGGMCLYTTPNRLLFSPQGDSANPHHLSEMAWEEYRTIALQVFKTVHLQGIPQRCLTPPDHTGVPGVKPNAEIRLEDYRAQDDHLGDCENMLCFGWRDSNQRLRPNLPDRLTPVANTLAPAFWHSAEGRWLMLGLYPIGPSHFPVMLSPGQKLSAQSFTLPYNKLTLIEWDVIGTPKQSVELVLTLSSVELGVQYNFTTTLQPFDTTVRWKISPPLDIANQSLTWQVKIRRAWQSWFSNPSRVVKLASSESAQWALRTFHAQIPKPERVAN